MVSRLHTHIVDFTQLLVSGGSTQQMEITLCSYDVHGYAIGGASFVLEP